MAVERIRFDDIYAVDVDSDLRDGTYQTGHYRRASFDVNHEPGILDDNEIRVLTLSALARRITHIAQDIEVSQLRVNTVRTSIRDKLEVTSNVEAVKRAFETSIFTVRQPIVLTPRRALSSREQQVWELARQGNTDEQISTQLQISRQRAHRLIGDVRILYNLHDRIETVLAYSVSVDEDDYSRWL